MRQTSIRWIAIAAAIGAGAGSFSSAAAEDGVQSLDSIRAAAEKYALSQVRPGPGGAAESIRVEADRLDPRLRLSACEQPLQAYLPVGMTVRDNTTIGVRCNGRTPWALFVPVHVAVTRPVVVLARPLNRGDIVSAGDLTVEPRAGNFGINGYFSDPAEVIGKVLTRPAGAGQAVTSALLTSNQLIRRGQSVTLVASTGGIDVRVAGTAMMDGAEGDRIKVKNSSSDRIVEGVVRDGGVVEIGF